MNCDSSLFDSGVIVLGLSSFNVILHFPKNNSLNLSKIIVGKFERFFNIRQELSKIAVKNNQDLNSIIYLIMY